MVSRASNIELELATRLEKMVRLNDDLMEALHAVRSLNLTNWSIAAGAVRSAVWDQLHGYTVATPLDDIDVVYFNAEVLPENDQQLEQQLRAIHPKLNWEVTNQANVHHWFFAEFGQKVEQLSSLVHGISTWPEYATCVGITMAKDDSIEVIAPHGLNDLFTMLVRHNPSRSDVETFLRRINAKKFQRRWPLIKIVDPI